VAMQTSASSLSLSSGVGVGGFGGVSSGSMQRPPLSLSLAGPGSQGPQEWEWLTMSL
jgi:hypothetical protein